MGVQSLSVSASGSQFICQELIKECSSWSEIEKATTQGRWRYLKGFFHRTEPILHDLVGKVNRTFACLEQDGVEIIDLAANYEKCQTKIYFTIAEEIERKISKLKECSPALKKSYRELRLRAASLSYLSGEGNGGLNALDRPDTECLQSLRQRANAWHEKQKLAVNPLLNEVDEMQLKELAKYPEWVKVVLEDQEDLEKIFALCLRSFNPVEVIVKSYEIRKVLKDAKLDSNIGYVRNLVLTKPENEILAFREISTKVNHVSKRILTAPIYHGSFEAFESKKQERFNILNPKEKIQFKQGNYTLSVEEFLKEIGQKDKREANINLCADWGFVNFHPIKGVWNADEKSYEMPKMMADDWFKKAPPARIASHAELLEQYGNKVENRTFFFKVMATRKNLDLNALEAHAFWQLYFRMKDGNWRVLNVGAYAYRYQQGILDGLWLFCATILRVLCLMDQNGYYTHRLRGAFVVFPEEERLVNKVSDQESVQTKLISDIYEFMKSSGVFQFVGRNCAYAVQTISKQTVRSLPNFFRMPLTLASSGISGLDRILAWAHRQGEWVRWLIINILQTILLSHRSQKIKEESGVVYYSTREYFKKEELNIYNPSYLPHQIARDKKEGSGPFVNGELYWSHTDEKVFQVQALARPQAKDVKNSQEKNEWITL